MIPFVDTVLVVWRRLQIGQMKTRAATLSPRTAMGIHLKMSPLLRSSLCLWGRFMTMKDRNRTSWASKQVCSWLVQTSDGGFWYFLFVFGLNGSSLLPPFCRWRVCQNWRGGRSGLVQRPAEGWTNRPISCKLRRGHSVDIYPQRKNQCEQRRRRRKCFMMQAVNENTLLCFPPFSGCWRLDHHWELEHFRIMETIQLYTGRVLLRLHTVTEKKIRICFV